MDTGTYGIKESVEILKAMGEAAVLCHAGSKAVAALPADTPQSEKIKAFAQTVATQAMLNPSTVQTFKDAFDNAGEALNEVKDLGLVEGCQLAMAAGEVMVSAAQRVKAQN